MKHRNIVIGLVLITFLIISIFVLVTQPSVPAESETDQPFLVGVEIGWEANVTECKAVIDEVKNYTNLLILAHSEIMGDEVSLNETCDYAYDAGMYILVWFGSQLHAFHASMGVQYYPFLWTMKAKERYGDRFLGAYFKDEIGGRQLERGRQLEVTDAIYQPCYKDFADDFIRSNAREMDAFSYIAPYMNFSMFISDFGLFWFDYKVGYDVVLAEFVKNNNRALQVALCRGAAQLQNKDWGIMITWEQEEPPYIESANKLYDDMVFAYNSGANYVVVYDSWSKDHTNSSLTDDHLDALKNFWEYVQENPDKHRSFEADTVLVLPEAYGFGFRNPRDTIWGYNTADNWTEKMYYDVHEFLDEYGSGLDIVYSDPEFNDALEKYYSEVLTWTFGSDADKFPVVNLDTDIGYSTIQEAVNAFVTFDGHKILVKGGVYAENVYIGKGISLVGEDKDITMITGDNNNSAIMVFGDGVNVTGFTIRNGGNNTTGIGGGVHLIQADNCNISGNIVIANNFGVFLENSGNNTLRNNQIFDNMYNFGVTGISLFHYVNYVDSSNTVDGKPILYWINEHDREVPSDVGYVAIVNCTDMTIKNLQLSNNINGLLIVQTRNSILTDNIITSNWEGLRFDFSSDNILSGNSMHDNKYNLLINGQLPNDFGTTNTIDGKSIIYWIAQHNKVVPSNAGYVVLIDCTGITVKNLELSNNLQGVLLINTRNSTITQNTITNQVNGIELEMSHNNTITNNFIDTSSKAGVNLENSDSNSLAGNTIVGNEAGIYFNSSSSNSIYRNNLRANNYALQVIINFNLDGSSNNTIIENNITLNEFYLDIEPYLNANNTIYHNNFINNTNQLMDYFPVSSEGQNSWDNGSEGNYWSDYEEIYPNASELGNSGVWDTPCTVNHMDADNYPLVQPFPIPSFLSP